jgi:hypothetical protein
MAAAAIPDTTAAVAVTGSAQVRGQRPGRLAAVMATAAAAVATKWMGQTLQGCGGMMGMDAGQGSSMQHGTKPQPSVGSKHISG